MSPTLTQPSESFSRQEDTRQRPEVVSAPVDSASRSELQRQSGSVVRQGLVPKNQVVVGEIPPSTLSAAEPKQIGERILNSARESLAPFFGVSKEEMGSVMVALGEDPNMPLDKFLERYPALRMRMQGFVGGLADRLSNPMLKIEKSSAEDVMKIFPGISQNAAENIAAVIRPVEGFIEGSTSVVGAGLTVCGGSLLRLGVIAQASCLALVGKSLLDHGSDLVKALKSGETPKILEALSQLGVDIAPIAVGLARGSGNKTSNTGFKVTKASEMPVAGEFNSQEMRGIVPKHGNVVEMPKHAVSDGPVFQPNKSYRVEIDGVKSAIRVAGESAQACYVENPQLIQKLAQVSREQELCQNIGKKFSELSQVEKEAISAQASHDTEGIRHAFFDKSTGRMYIAEWNGKAGQTHAEYVARLQHETSHYQDHLSRQNKPLVGQSVDLIDDEARALVKASESLAAIGYQYRLAENGSQQIVKCAEGQKPEIVSYERARQHVEKSYTQELLSSERLAALNEKASLDKNFYQSGRKVWKTEILPQVLKDLEAHPKMITELIQLIQYCRSDFPSSLVKVAREATTPFFEKALAAGSSQQLKDAALEAALALKSNRVILNPDGSVKWELMAEKDIDTMIAKLRTAGARESVAEPSPVAPAAEVPWRQRILNDLASDSPVTRNKAAIDLARSVDAQAKGLIQEIFSNPKSDPAVCQKIFEQLKTQDWKQMHEILLKAFDQNFSRSSDPQAQSALVNIVSWLSLFPGGQASAEQLAVFEKALKNPDIGMRTIDSLAAQLKKLTSDSNLAGLLRKLSGQQYLVPSDVRTRIGREIASNWP